MLVLTRKVGELLQIGDEIRVKVMAVNGNQVKVGIDAPRHIAVSRPDMKKGQANGNQ